MKIAIFYNLTFSGAKRTVLEHVRGLKALGHAVDVYTLDGKHDIFDPGSVANNEHRYEYRQRMVNLPFLKRLAKDLSDFILLKSIHKKIAQDIDSKGYDIALIHTDRITQSPFILRFLQTKNIYFCLEPLKMVYEYGLRISDNLPFFNKAYEAGNRYLRKKIDRENARSAQSSIAVSYFGRELMIQAFDLYPKISYLGVNAKKFKNLRIPKKNQILFVGQKLKLNGYEYALEAIKLVPEKIRPELKILSISKDKNKRLSDEEVVKLYNESLITLSLSNFDTFGLVALESLACEVPVIAFNAAGYRETMIDGKTGYLVDFSSQAIANKIIRLLQNQKLRDEMGKFGRKWVEDQWTWEKQIKSLEALLRLFIRHGVYQTAKKI
jgi:glycosyltransferase involved in cell wall biosynthesis